MFIWGLFSYRISSGRSTPIWEAQSAQRAAPTLGATRVDSVVVAFISTNTHDEFYTVQVSRTDAYTSITKWEEDWNARTSTRDSVL